MRLAIAALVFMSACAVARAQQPIEPAWREDIAAIGACLDAQAPALNDAEPGKRACIGEVTRTCTAPLGDAGATTGAIVLCLAREERAWRAHLDQSAMRLRETESDNQIALLDRALEVGAEWTRARCTHYASTYEGGSLARVLAAHCARDTNAERAIDLHDRLNPLE